MKERLPLDPVDPKTPLSRDYQVGNVAWVILLTGVVGGALLLGAADYGRMWGWLQAAAGVLVIAGTAFIARKLIKSI